MRRICFSALLFCLLFTSQSFALAPSMAAFSMPSLSMMPTPPTLNSQAFVLMDPKSAQILASKAMDKRVEPASLTKLMSLFIIAHALQSQQIHLDDQVLISKNAWRTPGSRMFVKAGTKVSVEALIHGITVASGNDATIALVEHVAGTEASFVSLMNQVAKNLDMHHTHFANATGLPNPQHYTTAHDLARLAAAWQAQFPEYYAWFSKKWIKYNNIKQPNRNRLLWRDAFVDGMKTGHTKSAGYCLIASGKQKNTRLISVILGAKSDAARTEQSEKLLNYGFHFYSTKKILSANTPIAHVATWMGQKSQTPVITDGSVFITVPKYAEFHYQTKLVMPKPLIAPIKAHQPLGDWLVLSEDGSTIKRVPVFALQPNPKGSFIMTLVDRIRLFVHPPKGLQQV